ncbi:translation initiation factor eIF-2A [Serendipita vermifera]|nr:translation initiation factor eIF-2A [Serendipita vermifera]
MATSSSTIDPSSMQQNAGQSLTPYSQYSFRAQKDLGLVYGAPSYRACDFQKPEGTARATQYSSDGRLFGIALPDHVRIISAANMSPICIINIPNVIELGFSPKGTFISTWERQQKPGEDGSVHKNLKVWSVQNGELLASFGQKNQEGWDLQYTASESHALRLAGPEIQVYNPSNWSEGAISKLRLEGMNTAVLSPGANPSVAIFVPEKSGTPGSVKVYNLQTLSAPPSCQKSFFKADRATIRWNSLGTLALIMTHTEVDKTNKSYYGETGLYLMSAAGNFDSRIILDKEGPIHDFAWNPNSKEFCVVYGFMPAKATLFDQRVKAIYDFGAHPHNFVSWNPQGRLLALAGFGNLAGKINIFDRRHLSKLAEIDAPNSSHFEWNHDGTMILTATLSPRLRVDNGIKIWWCSGKLLHVQTTEELYQANWRPIARNGIPPFPQNIPVAPEASTSAQSLPAKPVAAKPAGAYRPPGAQGRAAPSIFKREDEGGSGTQTPPRGVPGSMGYYEGGANGHGRGAANGISRGRGEPPRGRGQGGRHVPGAAASVTPTTTPPPDGDRGARKKKGKGKREEGEGGGSGTASGRQTPMMDGRSTPNPRDHESHDRGKRQNPHSHSSSGGMERGKLKIPLPAKTEETFLTAPADVSSPLSPGIDGNLDPTQKKIRNLSKKLKAIEELKERVKRGEKLETTQYKKIESENEIKKELAALNAA